MIEKNERLSEKLRAAASGHALSNTHFEQWADHAAQMEDELIRTRVAVRTARNTHKEFDILFEKYNALKEKLLAAEADVSTLKIEAIENAKTMVAADITLRCLMQRLASKEVDKATDKGKQ